IFAAPGVSDQPMVQQQTQAPLILPKYNQQLPPPNRRRVTTSSTRKTSPATTRKATPLPAVPAQATQFNYVQIDTNTIEFVAPETQTPTTTVTTQQQSWPTHLSPTQSQVSPQPSNASAVSNNNDLLPVPDGNIPLGNTRNMQKISPTPTNTISYAGNYSSSSAPGVRYRVVVEALTDREQELVKNLAPGAFPTIWQSRRVMQVGVFSDRNNANEMLKILTNNGLRTIIEPLN
ncbi:MAG: DUF1565 domain-containing protein, partial [Trichormus sp.]